MHTRARKSTLCENSPVKCRAPRPGQTNNLCEPAQSKSPCMDMQTCQKSHIMREFSGKMPQANIKQTPRRRLCASLRSRNAHGHRTRASLCENLQERSRKPDGAPWSSTGLYSYRNNPSVWTQCLGNILDNVQNENTPTKNEMTSKPLQRMLPELSG